MTQEALKLALEALDDLLYWDNGKPEYDEARKALQVGKQALAQTQEPVATLFGSLPVYDTTPPQRTEQEPMAWKLMPRDATDSMLKAMDECSTEGYDERLYAGHAASVYMAAWDEAPTPPQRKPLTDEEIEVIAKNYALNNPTTPLHFARAIEAAHGIKEKNNG